MNNNPLAKPNDTLTLDSNLFKALADVTRLRLLRLLFREELNVQELAFILQIGQPSISRHLAYLKKVALVIDRKEGTRVYYQLSHFKKNIMSVSNYLKTLGESQHPDLERLEQCLYSRVRQAHQFADDSAEHWDEIGRLLHNSSASLLAISKLVPNELTLADLGTGTGVMLPFLAELGKKVYAIDQSEQMLKQAMLRCKRLGIKNVEFIHSPIEDLKDKLPPCDGILLHFVLHQLASPTHLIQSAYKLLKKGGRISIVDRIKHDDEHAKKTFGSLWLGFTENQLKEWIKDAGFIDNYWHPLVSGDSAESANLPIFVSAACK